jgi:hypothetical protein
VRKWRLSALRAPRFPSADVGLGPAGGRRRCSLWQTGARTPSQYFVMQLHQLPIQIVHVVGGPLGEGPEVVDAPARAGADEVHHQMQVKEGQMGDFVVVSLICIPAAEHRQSGRDERDPEF